MFWKRLLCIRKIPCVLEKTVVFPNRLLCYRKDCCVLKKIVALSKRLMCSSKDCCVSEQELSCVLPIWATVTSTIGLVICNQQIVPIDETLTSVLRAELFLSKAFAMACNGSASLDSASAHRLKIGMYSLYTSRRSEIIATAINVTVNPRLVQKWRK